MTNALFEESLPQFVAYYDRLAEEKPNDPHWRKGANLCHRLQTLLAKEQFTHEAVDEVIDELLGEEQPGSGWIDLKTQFARWARRSGFIVK